MKQSSHYYLGVDSSTTATKAVAWTSTGEVLAEGRQDIDVAVPRSGYAEQNAEDWWESTCAALRQCVEQVDPRAAAALALTVQRESFVLLDTDFAPVRPAILWYDARAVETAGELEAGLDADSYHRRTGKQLDVTSALGKMAWLRRNEPRVFERTAFFADVLAFLACRLTGRLATTAAGADTTGLIDVTTQAWHGPYVAYCGLTPANLPRLVAPGGRLGVLGPRVAKITGLPAGLPVVAGGGDGHCTSLGAGRCRERTATLSLGTSAVLGVDAGEPLLGDDFRTLIACIPSRFILESVIQCGSATVSWLLETFLGQSATPADLRSMERQCAEIPPGSEGLLTLPHWRGVRAPHNDPSARGVVLGWRDHHTAAHLHRSILEGIAFEVAGLLDRVVSAHNVSVDNLVVTGGGAASDLWCRILADALDMPCLRPASVETASLGAAILACSAVEGVPAAIAAQRMAPHETRFEPRSHAAALYARLRRLHARMYAATRRLSHDLEQLSRRDIAEQSAK